jgi:hypothetical protein
MAREGAPGVNRDRTRRAFPSANLGAVYPFENHEPIYYNIFGREQRGMVIHDQEHSCPADFSRNETLTG